MHEQVTSTLSDGAIGRVAVRVDYPLSMVAAMDNATRDSGGSRRGLALGGFFGCPGELSPRREAAGGVSLSGER